MIMSDTFDEERYLAYLETDPYVKFVAMEAEKMGKLLFIDSGEGKDFLDPKTGWLIERLSCWLIDPDDKERFLLAFQRWHTNNDDAVFEEFSDEYRVVEWTMTEEEGLKISFVIY